MSTPLLVPIAALELIHTYSLVHDDLPALDNDDLRRGRKTTHVVFGEAMGILTGDALLTEAFAWLARPMVGVDAAQQLRADRRSRDRRRLEGHDRRPGRRHHRRRGTDAIDARELLDFIHRNKTGKLLTASVVLGGLLGERAATRRSTRCAATATPSAWPSRSSTTSSTGGRRGHARQDGWEGSLRRESSPIRRSSARTRHGPRWRRCSARRSRQR